MALVSHVVVLLTHVLRAAIMIILIPHSTTRNTHITLIAMSVTNLESGLALNE